MEFKDYYATLGLSKTATDADIKRAYRKLARKFHPDLNPGDKTAEAKFKDINEANEVLGDPEKRRKYDELGANWRMYEQTPPPGQRPRTSYTWTTGGSSQGPYRTMSAEDMQEIFGTEDPFSDFFHAFFGGRGPGAQSARAPRRPARGQNLESAIDLTLEEAFTGTSRKVKLSGEGRDRTIEVRIPAGVHEGARVRAAGEGGQADGGPAGDLFLVVRVLPHPRFERRGQDLHVRIPVPVTTAVLGGEASVPTLSGSTLRLKVPELTSGGRVFRLRGHGMPAVGKPDERGDLYATVDLQIPSQITAEERKHFEALKALEERRSS